MSAAKAQEMADKARDRIQGMWTSLRSMTFDDDGKGSLTKIKKAMELHDPSNPWEVMVKTMFGSCTNGIHEESSPASSSSRSSKSPSCEPNDPSSPTRGKEEFFYSQFLSHDHTRAKNAVSSLRGNADKGISEQSFERKEKSSVPKPFPVSSPPRKALHVPPVLVQEIVPQPQRQVGMAMSFDDGISAISAHTLEEMARQEELQREARLGPVGSDLTSEAFETVPGARSGDSSSFPHSYSPERSAKNKNHPGSPFDLCRNNSRVSQLSKRSKGTRSTQSSQTSDFETTWRKDEQNYWRDIAQNDGTDDASSRRHQEMLRRVEALKERSRSGRSRDLRSHGSVSRA
jgi:hypothetical protein